MSRILRIYVIKEVLLSTFLTLVTIVFVMLVGQVYQLITLLMQPSVSMLQMCDVLLSLTPTLLVLAIPMATLVGVLIGVGRMTLDREMLAAKASGINLFTIFFPMIFLGLLLSFGIMGLNSKVIPRLFHHAMVKVTTMQMALITSLESGRFYSPRDMGMGGGLGDFGGGLANFEFYFRERDPKDSNIMKGFMIKLGSDSAAAKKSDKADKTDKADKKAPAAVKKKGNSPLDGIVSSATMARASAALDPAATTSSSAASAPAVADAGAVGSPRNALTLITAECGVISQTAVGKPDARNLEEQKTQIVLTLKNGTVHRLNPDPKDRQYMVVSFAQLDKRLFGAAEIKKGHKGRTNQELWEIIRTTDPSQARDKSERKDMEDTLHSARRDLTERYAMSLASFVFILVGIPLAIWVRPSGKSWGILLAVGLMLIYFILTNFGLGMVEYNKPLGYIVTFSPDFLFLILGAGLWWQAVRS